MGESFLIIPAVFAVLLLGGIGCAIRFGKAYGLINSYNSLSEEKKKNVDIAGLGRFLGNCLIIGAVMTGLGFVLLILKITWVGIALFGLLLPGLIFMIIRVQKYDGNAKRADGGMSTQTKVTLVMLVIVLGGVGVGMYFLISSGMKPVECIITSDTLEIKCAYGGTVKLADIQGLELAEARPGIETRTFGSAVGDKLRGSFELVGGKPAKIYEENATPPFVHFTVGSTEYYINCKTPEATNSLYSELEKSVK